MKRQVSRVLVSGTNSGCGKTTLVCGILRALLASGRNVRACKAGPDYIDPMFHEAVVGVESVNLDPYFCDENTLRFLLARHGSDEMPPFGSDEKRLLPDKNSSADPLRPPASSRPITVIEGVMGFYDGVGPEGSESTYELSEILRAPVVVVVNAKGMSNSALAILKGFAEFRPNLIRGVVFNQTTAKTYELLKAGVLREFGGKIKPLGYLGKLPGECIFESRHLGLVTAAEICGLRERLDRLAELVSETVDLEGIREIAGQAEPLEFEPIRPTAAIPDAVDVSDRPLAASAGHSADHSTVVPPVRIAVARDAAFCFYYRDNLRFLEEMGAKLLYFSPMTDEILPEADGLILGGGYPELYAERLEENRALRRQIKQELEAGLPCIAECGGFLYLNRSLDGHEMVGFLDGDCENRKKLTRFGYVELRAREDNLLCRAGETLRAHEFHYYDCTENGDGFEAQKQSGESWNCAIISPVLYAGFPHFSFYGNPEAGANFFSACLRRRG